AAAGDPVSALQTVESGVPFTGSNYGSQQTYSNSTTVGGSTIAVGTSWSAGSVNQVAGSWKFMKRPAGVTWAGIAQYYMITAAAARYWQGWCHDGGANPATTTGFRLLLGSSSFLAGSYLRAYVVI